MDTLEKKTAIKGGEFLIRETEAKDIFIPEEFSEEQKMMAQACEDFISTEIDPVIERIEKMEEGLVPSILEKAGELGLLGVTIPEEYGGLGMSFNTSMLMADIIGAAGSFSTTFGAHTGIGTLPIQYYGNDEQKAKYLSKLGTGEWKAAYCLTEPDAGSDANSGKTKAVLNEAGTHYLISGQKMWISNAGFADVFIVFAKIEDDKNLTAFIVEKDFGNITLGDEEKKLGIKGSSTRQVFFENTPVPVENMLSERQNGFKIAVNILNIGRIKLGVGVVGGCKRVIDEAVNYGIERKQFGTSIANFGAIKHKLAEMAIQTFAVESAAYRAGQNVEDKIEDLKTQGLTKEQAILKGVEQFAIECAILKILGSEALDYVVDEGVQIYGGMGFSADAPMERAYRDSRISRIYEGTNEINRMLLVGMILKRAMKGQLDILGPAMAVAKELTSLPSFGEEELGRFGEEKKVIANLKKAILMVAGKAAQDLGPKINDEQELLMNLADMVVQVYGAESILLRAEKYEQLNGEEAAKQRVNMAKVYLYEAVDNVHRAGKEAIANFAQNDDQNVLVMGLRRFTKAKLVNTKALRREIADTMIEAGKYAF
ncbi:acyl-CoA dehydrogenase family protein [Pontibacter sp. G13]|uniref:acyl-CoA dehydrogenase family protein n=1 Tax=Pontibacter sp. G13 TaxID=3074898 RepID=UPI00288A7A0E|nr:acyl-CoA dehydrogenase family protein [Pontibacter sp. G13]WNJ20418.1 acyl-CoA dehydrogenase family protein [Pontibacter sp. G13]